ncbi:MAG: hypothetical protein R3250_06355, partial [Melioribacteraceae bacterium]|nr:hypothetical protein [Melioribacteraceae bacterium]
FMKVIYDFKKLYDTDPSIIISDDHPEYLSTKFARSLNSNLSVQHHFAHIASCRAENEITGSSLGVAWDGTGFGLDNTIWGGEFILSDENNYHHIAQFKQFLLLGGEKAIKEGRRSALGVLFEVYGNDIFQNSFLTEKLEFKRSELKIFQTMLNKKLNSPKTSSVGRLFDAVSAILGISQISNYEGQSAMKLEFVADKNVDNYYPFEVMELDKFIIEWKPIILSVLDDIKKGLDISNISAKFHNTLAKIILEIAKIIGENKVILSGGCFQNIYLLERTVEYLEKNKFNVYFHQRIPTNDGGISLGQIAAADIKYSEFNINSIQNSFVNT